MDDIAILNAEADALEKRARIIRQQAAIAEHWVARGVVAEFTVERCLTCGEEQTVSAQTYVEFTHRGTRRLLATPIPQLPIGLPRSQCSLTSNVNFCPTCVAAQFVNPGKGA